MFACWDGDKLGGFTHCSVNEEYQTSQLSGGSEHRSVFFLCFWNRPWTWWECGPCGSTSIFWGSQCCDFASQELQVGHNPICYYKTLVFGLLKTPSSWGAGPSIGPTKILRNTPSTLLCQVKNATTVAKCAQQRSSFPQGGNARTIACNPGGPTDDGSLFVVMSFCYI